MIYQNQINSRFSNEIFIWQNIQSSNITFYWFWTFSIKNSCKRWIIDSNEWMMIVWDWLPYRSASQRVAYHFGFNENVLNSSRQTNTTQIVIHLSFPSEDDVRAAATRGANTSLEWEFDKFWARYQPVYGLILIILRSMCTPWAKAHQANRVRCSVFSYFMDVDLNVYLCILYMCKCLCVFIWSKFCRNVLYCFILMGQSNGLKVFNRYMPLPFELCYG